MVQSVTNVPGRSIFSSTVSLDTGRARAHMSVSLDIGRVKSPKSIFIEKHRASAIFSKETQNFGVTTGHISTIIFCQKNRSEEISIFTGRYWSEECSARSSAKSVVRERRFFSLKGPRRISQEAYWAIKAGFLMRLLGWISKEAYWAI